MNWSLRLGRVFGIDVYLHWTFLALLVGIFLVQVISGGGLVIAIGTILFLIALFGCVVLHELGHALMARHFDVPTLDITLFPIGGVARLLKMPEKPSEELLVALAGPAVNIVIAVVLAGLLFFYGGFALFMNISPADLLGAPFLLQLFAVNLFLVLFNMVPAFPMDGGRVLRSLLAFKIDFVQSTWIAARIGQGMALFFGFIAIFTGAWQLLFIAVFIYFGAQAEARFVQMRYAYKGSAFHKAMGALFPKTAPPNVNTANQTNAGPPPVYQEVYEVSPDGKQMRKIWVDMNDPAILAEALKRKLEQ